MVVSEVDHVESRGGSMLLILIRLIFYIYVCVNRRREREQYIYIHASELKSICIKEVTNLNYLYKNQKKKHSPNKLVPLQPFHKTCIFDIGQYSF